MPPIPRPPILVNFGPDGLIFDRGALVTALAALPDRAPVVVLIHGYRFEPGLSGQCPHHHIFAPVPRIFDGKEISWPRHLGLDGTRGLAIALGWPARGSLWRAHATASQVGAALAEFAELFRLLAPGRVLNIFAHSLGTRVALTALEQARPGAFGRLILLAGAETRSMARRALSSPGGQGVEVVNVTTRENDLFDAAFEWLLHFGRQWSIGQGLGDSVPNWRDLWIDQDPSRDALARRGFPLPPPSGRVSHWSSYLRAGVFPLYRAVLTGRLPLAALPQTKVARRWSLLMRAPGLRWARAMRAPRAPGQAIP